jgi:hypothetical protein
MASERLHKAINMYVEYYNMKPSRIGAVAIFLIYLFQRYMIKRIDKRLNNTAKTI